MAIVQFKKCVSSLDAGNDALGGKCMRQTPSDGGEDQTDVDRVEREDSRTAAAEWWSGSFREYFEHCVCCMGKYFCASFYYRAPVKPSPIYIKRFFQESAIRLKRVHNQNDTCRYEVESETKDSY